jgi:1,4-alpha-glucan branching enzyme
MSHKTRLSTEEQAAIVGGYHRDVFRVLGQHTADGVTVVRVFEPSAEKVTVHAANTAFPMPRIHPGGLFEVALPEPGPYELEITWPTGVTARRADTYAMPSTISDFDRYLLAEGTDMRMYDKLGAHMLEVDGVRGVRFAVWAPNAERVSVVGDFNQWDGRRHPMRLHPGSGIWELFVPNLTEGEKYKYEVRISRSGMVVNKSDPVGFYAEMRPDTASIVWDLTRHAWNDAEWMASRAERHHPNAPINIYELHPGSWQRGPDNRWLTWEELIDRLVPYIKWMGYTHIELMPVAEHPYDGSWGYQVTGYYAATSRYGTPEQLMALIDACHQAGIGVILDWVPAHFPKDAHGLGFFDGTRLYEHDDPRQGEHPDWGTYVFNFDRLEVRQFLIANALFWAEKYHIDGLRVDAVASMLYLDFSRKEGQWIPNVHGGRENLGAIHFLREFNQRLHGQYPDVLTIAEESTAWPGVTKPTTEGGLGFDLKWNMGWMNDTLQYISTDSVFRAYHHGTITFSMLYAFSERFVLPFSHDEVVHLKKSMIGKMPGDSWQQFANLRALYGYMMSHPGKKLLFMGSEFAQWNEWTEKHSLDWHLVQRGWPHEQMQLYVRDLNLFYRTRPEMHQDDAGWEGFQWLEVQDSLHSVLAYMRRDPQTGEFVVVACNFTPVVRHGYRLGVPVNGVYREVLNSDAPMYGGSGVLNGMLMASEPHNWRGQPASIVLSLPPLSVVYLKLVEEER